MKSTSNTAFKFANWIDRLPDLNKLYQEGQPFPHIVMDNFLPESTAQKACENFPKITDDSWIHYLHFNEKKHGLNKRDSMPNDLSELIGTLNSDPFVQFLSELTGIEGLRADQSLEGGGLHQSSRGGFLNIHSDFTSHPHQKKWRRRVNVLIYLNDDWKDAYHGQLELWNPDMSECVRRISPLLNRCVIFNTDQKSFHGHPAPLECPEDVTRKSIALYYFTNDNSNHAVQATHYEARPEDKSKQMMISLDNAGIAIYSKLKRNFGFGDGFISKLLRSFRNYKNK